VTRAAGGVRLVVRATADEARREAASLVADLLVARGAQGATLALPTGETPRGVYDDLVRRHRGEDLSFRHATVFGLDEYWPMTPDDPRSFRRFLEQHLLGRVDVAPARRFHLDGGVPAERVAREAARFERALQVAGGLDLALLGLGRNGHIAFNEPGSPRDSRTRLVTLEDRTRIDLARAFGGADAVPRQALTMGVATLLAARRVVLVALGAHKADVVARTLGGPVGPDCPASFLREHPDACFVLDRESAARI